MQGVVLHSAGPGRSPGPTSGLPEIGNGHEIPSFSDTIFARKQEGLDLCGDRAGVVYCLGLTSDLGAGLAMTDTIITPTIKDAIKAQRPRLHKVILINDDFTPREFVVLVLKAEFRMNEDQAMHVMMTAHKRGSCVVGVFTKDIAEAKATRATNLARSRGYPLLFTTEPEE
jgi:ATP-dependent Clp protease adaptor protein ClpS